MHPSEQNRTRPRIRHAPLSPPGMLGCPCPGTTRHRDDTTRMHDPLSPCCTAEGRAQRQARRCPASRGGTAQRTAPNSARVRPSDRTQRQRTDALYLLSARSQAYQVLNDAPRTPDGAISHRMSDVQLWSDSTYMVPPFLAYYAALTSNQTMMQEAYMQCKLYRQYLGSASGLWRRECMITTRPLIPRARADLDCPFYSSPRHPTRKLGTRSGQLGHWKRMGCGWDDARAGDDEELADRVQFLVPAGGPAVVDRGDHARGLCSSGEFIQSDLRR